MSCKFPNFTAETVVAHQDKPQLITFAAAGVDLVAVRRQQIILDDVVSRIHSQLDSEQDHDIRKELRQDIALVTSLHCMLGMIRDGAAALYVPIEPVGRIVY